MGTRVAPARLPHHRDEAAKLARAIITIASRDSRPGASSPVPMPLRPPGAGPCRLVPERPVSSSSAPHRIPSPRTSSGGSGRPALASRVGEEKGMRRARRSFGTPRFRALRRAPEVDSARAVDGAMSRNLADVIERREGGGLNAIEIAPSVTFVSPPARQVPTALRGNREGNTGGEQDPRVRCSPS